MMPEPKLPRPAEPTGPPGSDLSVEELRQHYPELMGMLLRRREEIIRRQDEARNQANEQVLSSPGDDADLSVLDTSADYFLALASSHRAELLEIRDSLDRMDHGVYGICADCGEPIALERLRRMPFARFCVACQSIRERGALAPVPKP